MPFPSNNSLKDLALAMNTQENCIHLSRLTKPLQMKYLTKSTSWGGMTTLVIKEIASKNNNNDTIIVMWGCIKDYW
jgi:hypothetical protein